jgi:ABC-type polysaccharide/polyol phosphate transport system ATPase subunit
MDPQASARHSLAARAREQMITSETAIAFDHVSKHFRTFASPVQRIKEALHPRGKLYHATLPVLRDLTFRIPGGQAVAVMGANGVGKSTLLHIVAGLVEPSSGVVAVNGRVYGLLDLAGSFAPELTGRENVRFFHDIVLHRAGDLAERERIVQTFAEIGEYFDRPVRTYSSGMFLRLAFATAISAEPDILLIDEVITVGDIRFQQKCYRRICELRDRGTTILLVTHTAEMVLGLCDRVLLLDRGELVFDGHATEGIDRYYQLFFKVPEQPTPETALDKLRYGMGGARIERCFASLDGETEAVQFPRGERVRLVMQVVFERPVAVPHFGFSCCTKHGIRLYAATTAIQSESPAPASAGERRRVEIAFDLAVAVRDLFIDLSVFELDRGSITLLDARMGTLHLSVSSLLYCDGLVDLRAVFAESPAGANPGGRLVGAQAPE